MADFRSSRWGILQDRRNQLGVPRNRVDANWHFIDNYSWKSGRHDVKFGYEFRRTTIMQVLEDNTFRGKLSFDDLTTFLEGLPSDGSQRSRQHHAAHLRK